MKARVVGCLTFGLAVAVLTGADFPQVQISNDVLRAKLYLPDPERGYYRGTRFDWSGVIASLKYKGHDYFGPLFDQHDPKVHDNIRGPVEDLRTNKAGLGYDEAKAGDTFVKIGVGVLRKPEERPRHSRRMTHLCSDRVTHTKNRPCPWARSEQAISSTPKACKVFGSAGPSRQLPVCTGPAREQYTTQLSVVVGHFWRAKYGHFSRVPKLGYPCGVVFSDHLLGIPQEFGNIAHSHAGTL